ncbi:hypothetical protein [Nostoc sp. LPT]|uniref:hypothetical protein n=1 Tax=Nostoc sp. LPT TaxID=2815387 RepID=UPI001DC146B6|nr:hypothetical protein [Nostoc sp. LPT]MBN4002506.1 hypothetical protein [Nostoc sp. LPT]
MARLPSWAFATPIASQTLLHRSKRSYAVGFTLGYQACVIAHRRNRLQQTDTPLHFAEHSSSTLFNITYTAAKFLSV